MVAAEAVAAAASAFAVVAVAAAFGVAALAEAFGVAALAATQNHIFAEVVPAASAAHIAHGSPSSGRGVR